MPEARDQLTPVGGEHACGRGGAGMPCPSYRTTSAIPTTRRGCRRASSGVKAWTIEMVQALILNRAPIGPNFEDYSVLEEGVIVGPIFLSPAAPQDRPWMWASGHNGKIRRPAHGYEPTHEAAMAHSPRDGDRNKRLRFAILLSPWVAVVLACPCASSFFGRHGRPPLALIFALILSQRRQLLGCPGRAPLARVLAPAHFLRL